MIRQAGDCIISSLGFTSCENYGAVKAGRSGIAHCENRMGLSEPFMAALIDREELRDRFAVPGDCTDGYTPFEMAAILSIRGAAAQAHVDLSGERTLFVLSTTKGNVHLLDPREGDGYPPGAALLCHSARRIAAFFGSSRVPLVVSNACISGACAQIEALRRLEAGAYDCAVVTGVDMLSRFIISGFQSFHALSPGPCRPFDAARDGLNLGEAASTLIYERTDKADAGGVALVRGAIRNDANHISGPSRTGEGCFLALQAVMAGCDAGEIAFVNAHGTATAYNDRMEAVALARAGLDGVPVNGLKGYFGHTLGAAGVLESVISSHALAGRTILPTLGFSAREDDSTLHVADRIARTEKPYFVKTLSGFGGSNAALLFHYAPPQTDAAPPRPHIRLHAPDAAAPLGIQACCRISDGRASVNGKAVFAGEDNGNGDFLTALYRSLKTDYPKFFKMDRLSKLGFLASELIFGDAAARSFAPRRDMAVICFNRSSSLDTDVAYQATIQRDDDYFPSPSLFVYTLPNIVAAEIAIRNRIYGETSFCVCPHFDAAGMETAVRLAFRDESVCCVLAAWVECFEGPCDALMALVGRAPSDAVFSAGRLDGLYHNQY
ncbi:MAG: 3-oxoacyl-ACP synthase [Tannerella sp.]|jgi:3-oxoacyl-[acyl-carrier-protein] synthase-1|nr:3-oxoacyl-ACP synthase [Tannerella sp.]